jgi:hypothetical protein
MHITLLAAGALVSLLGAALVLVTPVGWLTLTAGCALSACGWLLDDDDQDDDE